MHLVSWCFIALTVITVSKVLGTLLFLYNNIERRIRSKEAREFSGPLSSFLILLSNTFLHNLDDFGINVL